MFSKSQLTSVFALLLTSLSFVEQPGIASDADKPSEISVFLFDRQGHAVTDASVLCINASNHSEEHVCEKRDSKYSCAGLSPRATYLLRVHPPSRLKPPEDRSIGKPEDFKGDVIITLLPEVLKGKVVDQKSKGPVEGADVLVVPEKEPRKPVDYPTTHRDGSFESEKVERDSSYTLDIKHPKYVSYRLQRQHPGDAEITISLQPLKERSEYRFQMRRGTTITAQVIKLNGQTVTIKAFASDDAVYRPGLESREVNLGDIAAVFRSHRKRYWIIGGIVGGAAVAAIAVGR